ncbi:hypothetical protein SAMN05660330_04222 [Desulforhopalus singaporensis]|uniref:Uncharacterized protein n=2 Tax=Desulforhopalus singaporensis TaxID=91360 RepID=A0A1H0VTS9_9BACT|nr:hypothetical protein SAMN05660330_04222 [Desulforhopalus singaporensis]
MEKFSGPEDLYDELVENSDDHWLLGLVAFAIIEEQKIEWIKHQKNNNGGTPSPEDIKNWYEQQPKGVLLRAKDTAETRLKDYSNEIIEFVIDEQRREIEHGIIVNEIRETKRFWPQFGVNLAGGFVSALLFAALLTIVAFFVIHDTSPVEIGAELRKDATLEDQNYVKERSNKQKSSDGSFSSSEKQNSK